MEKKNKKVDFNYEQEQLKLERERFEYEKLNIEKQGQSETKNDEKQIDIEHQRLEIEKKRLDIENERNKKENNIFNKHLGVMMTGLISIIAVLNSTFQTFQKNEADNYREQRAYILKITEENNKVLRQLSEFIVDNRAHIFSGDHSENLNARNAMMINFPNSEVEKAFEKIKISSDNKRKMIWQDGLNILEEEIVKNGYTYLEIPQIINDNQLEFGSIKLIGFEQILKDLEKNKRLEALDKLVYKCNQDNSLISKLVANLRSEKDDLGYRVNLFTVLVLSRIPRAWESDSETFLKILNLTNSRYYEDYTFFKETVDLAISNYKRSDS